MTDDFDLRVRAHLADFIPRRMDELGLTNADVARAIGEDASKFSKIRRGLHTPSLSYCVHLAEVLQCSLGEFDPPPATTERGRKLQHA